MNTLAVIRRWLLAVLVFGIVGSGTELLLLEHYETPWQWMPLLLILVSVGVLVWHLAAGGASSIRALQATMVLFLLAGITGVGLHLRGAAAFQWEIDPSQSRWDVLKKAVRAKAPPVLAPGVLLQLGLVGLAYAHRHPSLSPPELGPQF